MSSRILFPSALFRFLDNSVVVQIIQTDEAGNSGIIAENSFEKLKIAQEYYSEICSDRKKKYQESKKKPEKEEVENDDSVSEDDF